MREKLIQAAIEAREKAYAPYSKYKVGAALLTESGKIYTGCNVENASFGATICAERTAAVKAISDGEMKFRALAVVVEGEPVAPCGICRQFLVEFGGDLQLFLGNPGGELVETTLNECLPGAFGSKYLS